MLTLIFKKKSSFYTYYVLCANKCNFWIYFTWKDQKYLKRNSDTSSSETKKGIKTVYLLFPVKETFFSKIKEIYEKWKKSFKNILKSKYFL